MSAPTEENASIGIFGIVAWAIRLLRENLAMVSLVVFTVILPSYIIFALLPAGPESATFQESLRYGRLWQLLLDATFGVVSSIMIVLLADAALRKEPISFDTLLSTGLGKYPRVMLTAIMAGLLLILGFICLVVPGMYLSVLWSFILPVVVLLNIHGWAALKKSAALVKGRWWSTLGYYIGFFFIILALALVASLPQMALIWAGTQGYLESFSSYADLTSSGAWLSFSLDIVASLPLAFVGVLEVIIGVVMFRIWEGSAIK